MPAASGTAVTRLGQMAIGVRRAAFAAKTAAAPVAEGVYIPVFRRRKR